MRRSRCFCRPTPKGPKALSTRAYAVPGSAFTYAIGKLALWSKSHRRDQGDEALKAGAFSKLSIANPAAAPYGAAAVETMKALGVYDALQPKIVQGNSIAQAFQFVDTRNAELGFVALSQLHGVSEGTRWLVPQNLIRPIRQDAVLLKKGENDEASRAFLEFLKGRDARVFIGKFGYALELELLGSLSPDIWQPVRLTLELATVTTLMLLVVATPLAWWLARSHAGGRRRWRPSSRLPLVLPPTVLGFYLLIALGPDGPGGRSPSLWGARTLAFTFSGLVVGSIIASMPFVVQPIRNAFAAIGDRPLEVAATLRASPGRAFWTVAAAAREPGASHRRGARLRPYGRRVRRCADDRRRDPRPDAGPLDSDL